MDVRAEFYVRVKPTEESIADAAQTLGHKTLEPMELKEFVEGKFVDALRVGRRRDEHGRIARTALRLRAESAGRRDGRFDEKRSGTGNRVVDSLDQTSRDFFNPNNAFDAQGLTKLTEEIEMRRKQRNAIEQDTQVEVARKNLEAQQQQLQISA